jgi:hypothetical protein
MKSMIKFKKTFQKLLFFFDHWLQGKLLCEQTHTKELINENKSGFFFRSCELDGSFGKTIVHRCTKSPDQILP